MAEKEFGITAAANDVVIDETVTPRKEENAPKVDNRASRRDIANNEPN
jgi:hypothetical protein